MYCGQATSVNHQQTHSIAYRRMCKRWPCPDCHSENCRKLKRQANAGKPDIAGSLTIGTDVGQSPTERANILRNAWRLIRRRALAEAKRDPHKRPRKKALARDFPDAGPERTYWPNRVRLHNGKLPFILVVETHESGEPHFHFLGRAKFLCQKWLSAQLRELTGAFGTEVTRIKTRGKAEAYVAKYIGKGPAKFEGCKRHWRSLDWIERQEEPEERQERPKPVWELMEYPLEDVASAHAARGGRVNWRGNSAELFPP